MGCASGKSGQMAIPKSITVYYWGPVGPMNGYARAIGIYLTLDQAGAKYVMKGPDEKPANGAMAVPIVDLDGLIIGQCPAILKVLGDIFGLSGKTFEEKALCLQAIEDMQDIYVEHKTFVEQEQRKNQWFTYLDAKLQGKKWMAGGANPTIADFHGVFAFEFVISKKIDFSAFPNMTQWWADIQKYPVVAKMKASCVDGRTMVGTASATE